ncbi:MAG TPA: RNA polymerase sigma factor SigJ [Longimicrobiales bacterium]|nr:RNA polymerase sigma factor SigJ [Longimicrobiales bacterium]
MASPERLAEKFEEHRPHLRAVAYRLLGSTSEAEDAVQESWIRLQRAGAADVANLRGWLTTVVARVCLDMLRARTSRREDPMDVRLPDPIVTSAPDPAADIVLADSVGLALLVVLETLEPAERLAFVLHDVFGVRFDEIAAILGRSPVAVRKLASRARQRVQNDAPRAEPDLKQQRRVADAFLDAARSGDFEGLLALLDPDIELRADGGALASASRLVRGAHAVLEQAERFSRGLTSDVVLVNGRIGFLSRRTDGRPFSVVALTIAGDRITRMDILADPDRIARLDLSAVRSTASHSPPQ